MENGDGEMKKILKRLLGLVLALVLFLPAMQSTAYAENGMNYACVFKASYYAEKNPDVAMVFGQDEAGLFNHFLTFGMQEGRIASPEFNVLAYAERYPDLKKAYGTNWAGYYEHYMVMGKAEGRIGTTDGSVYVDTEAGTETTVDTTTTITDAQLEKKIAKYLSESMFIGDSIMLGYRNYCMKSTRSGESSIVFHCVGSYAARNALAPVTSQSCHPMFQGRKMNPWQQLELCPQVKRVFIMLGMNDIAVTGQDGSLKNYLLVIEKLKAVNPNLEVHIMSMTYILEGQDRGSLSSANVMKFNEKLKTVAETSGYGYVDMATPLSDQNGHLAKQYCSDGFVHISRSGYNVWSDIIHAYVASEIYYGRE